MRNDNNSAKDHKYSITHAVVILFTVVVFIGAPAALASEAETSEPDCSDNTYLTSLSVRQTSAKYLYEYMKATYKGNCFKEENREAERVKLALISDIYIKAWSYAVLNKLFFFVSVLFAIVVLVWPSLSVIAPNKLGQKPIFKSAIVQTTVTAIAAASFFVYSDYKDKQLSSENLMRYVLYSKDNGEVLSGKVMEELARIDKGFSFSKIIAGGEK